MCMYCRCIQSSHLLPPAVAPLLPLVPPPVLLLPSCHLHPCTGGGGGAARQARVGGVVGAKVVPVGPPGGGGAGGAPPLHPQEDEVGTQWTI